VAELIEANWLLLVVALVIGLLVAWWVFVRSRRTRVESAPADEAQTPSVPRRNQALIDAPPAASAARTTSPELATRDLERAERIIPPAMPQGLADVSEASQAPQPGPVIDEAPARPAPAPAAPILPDMPDMDTAREPEPATGPTHGLVPTADPAFAIAPTVESEMAAAVSSTPTSPSPVNDGVDDLTRIKGLGPKIAAQLNKLGVTSFAHIAAWDEEEIDRIDAQLGRFQGRIRRDQWPEQARLLAAGDTGGYEERFGKL
jgi:predicted flap endonuclease-1-like 5' DNA nuclease